MCSAVDSVPSKTKNCAFFLRAINGFAWTAVSSQPGSCRCHVARCDSKGGRGIICILYGVGLTSICPLVRGGGFLSKWVRVFPCIIADPWSMGRCRRRWMNGSLAGIVDLSHGRVGRTQREARARPREGKPYFNAIEKYFRSSFDSGRCMCTDPRTIACRVGI